MSLASQLSRLAAPAAGGTMPDQTRKRKNVRASVIYTPREAADVSLDAIHEAALDGFGDVQRVHWVFSGAERRAAACEPGVEKLEPAAARERRNSAG